MSKIALRFLIAFILLNSFSSTFAQKITVEDFTLKNTFQSKSVSGINWMKDGKYYTTLSGNKIIQYNITTGQAEKTILDGSALTQPLTMDDYTFNADESSLLISTEMKSIYRRSYIAEYFIYDITTKTIKKLSDKGKQSYATFSPDGTKVAFVRQNNLFYVSLADGKEVQVTDDGKFNSIINGTTDWVYEEEFGFVVGFHWSVDSKKLAYYKFDESQVKEYNLQRWGNQLYPTDYKFKYPKAGEKNASVEVWFYHLDGAKKVKADLGNDSDFYVPRVMWTNHPGTLAVRKMNRLQNSLQLLHVNAETGQSSLIIDQKSETFVDLEFVDDLIYLKDGKHFISANESTGYKHLYLYTFDGKLVNAITSGNFEVISISGFNEKMKKLYYTSTEVSVMDRHLYEVSFDGKKKVKLSTGEGQHSINMSPDCQYYIDHYSHAKQPVVATLYITKGNKALKFLEKNEDLQKKIADYGIVSKEFFSFKTPEGVSLNGYFLKPANLTAGKKYPVLLYQYSGPGSQNASNNWGGGHFYFHQLLVQKEVIIAVVDTRGTGARGEQFKKMTYKQLGKYELEDLVSTGKYLAGLPYIDGERMGVWGWSYGGYMSALAMTKAAGTFKLGISVAPVTNWRFYDTIYTERYLQTPQLNASGYDDNSPLTHAAKLQGKFLLVHGTGDDNVHFQNSVLLQDALINAGKPFDSFYYPDKHHGIQGSKTRFHLYSMLVNYVTENL